MAVPKILVIAGSLRKGSHNVRLATLAARELSLAGAEVSHLSLGDYPLPIYDADLAKSAMLPQAQALKQLVCAHRGVFIASPEYNASVTPLLKNAIDWISTVRATDEPMLVAFQNRAFALGAASPGRSGGMQSLIALRQVLAVGCRALVLPEQVTVANSYEAFDDSGELKDARLGAQLKTVVQKLIDHVRLLGSI